MAKIKTKIEVTTCNKRNSIGLTKNCMTRTWSNNIEDIRRLANRE